jgi:hypothetical protein
MIFRNCSSPVRLFVPPNVEDRLHEYENDFLGRRFSDSEYIGLVVAHPCDTVLVAPVEREDPATGENYRWVEVYLRGETKPNMDSVWSTYRTRYGITRNQQGNIELIMFKFDVAPEAQGQGIAAQVFAMQARAAYNLGFNSIVGTAKRRDKPALDSSNGYYTWPRFGFDCLINDQMRSLWSLPPEFTSLEHLSDLLRSNEGRAWWKINGKSVYVDFDTDPSSQSMRIFRQYFTDKFGTEPDISYTLPSVRRVQQPRFDRDTEEPCQCP